MLQLRPPKDVSPIVEQGGGFDSYSVVLRLQSGGAYGCAIATKTPRYLSTTDTGQQVELDAGGRMAQFARCRLKDGDDLLFGADFRTLFGGTLFGGTGFGATRFALGHDTNLAVIRTHVSPSLKCMLNAKEIAEKQPASNDWLDSFIA
jgi:hypothetical protein